MEYGVEIWGWSEKKELEKIKINYIRWILKLDIWTPKYIIYKETYTRKLNLHWGARAVRFDQRVAKLEDNRLIKICWLEMQKNNCDNLYCVEREKYYNEAGYSLIYIRDKIAQDVDLEREVYERKLDIENQTLMEKINSAKYNARYKDILCTQLPLYLNNVMCGKYVAVIARLRCGNFENVNRYWLGEKDRVCVLCEDDWGTLEHYIEECEKTIEWTENLPGEKYSKMNKVLKGEYDKEALEALVKIAELIKEKRNDSKVD